VIGKIEVGTDYMRKLK